MYIAALDIGGTKTIAAVIDEKGQICEKKTFPTVVADWTLHLDKCVLALQDVISKTGISASSILGIGVSLPGIVNSEEGVLLYAPYAKWEHVPVAKYLTDKLNIRNVFCENDVNACAIGEQKFGFGKKYSDFVWMTVSTGVGGAVVVASELVKGAHGIAGELGHLKVEYTKPNPCPCGQFGCLEAHASGTATIRAINEKVKADPTFGEAFLAASVKQDGAGCDALARAGNKDALLIFEQIGTYLGRGISYCANILDTQAVIIGGGTSASLDLMISSVQFTIKKNTFEKMQNFEVVRTPLGYDAAILGAAALVMQG